MDVKAVTLMLRYKDAKGVWRRSPAAYGKNGRVKPAHVMIEGDLTDVGEGLYAIRHTVDRKTVYTPAGKNAANAAAKAEQLERTKSLVAVAATNPDVEIKEKPARKTLKETASDYIGNAENRGALEAAEQARLVTKEFLAVCRRTYVDEVTQDDIFAYHHSLKRQGRSDRTISNKHVRLASWLRYAGIDPKQIPPKPRFEAKLPDMYSSAQTRELLEHAKPYMRLLILVALKTGLRDQELRHIEFRDIHFEDKTLRVRAKSQWGFTVKTWEQRSVPVPDDVLDALREWQDKHESQSLIFGTAHRKPNSKLLKALKTLARQSGLNCGRCESCVGRRKECQEFTLHRFRRTYLTTLLRQGIDLRTVQAYAGHKDIASTMRYLTPETGDTALAKLNAVRW